MKLKADFVTNSSSVSFVVMGDRLDISVLGMEEGYLESQLFDMLEAKVANSDLSYSFGDSDMWGISEFMLGIQYTQMGDDETLGEFKARVKKEIKNVFGVEVEVGHIEEGWENR